MTTQERCQLARATAELAGEEVGGRFCKCLADRLLWVVVVAALGLLLCEARRICHMPETVQKHEFKTELRQLLDIIVHSLYTKREIFLRELISNAADAIDKLRFSALTDTGLAGSDTDYKIRLSVDKVAGTLTVSDNGIGMTRDEVIENLGTIARSGTKQFIEKLKATNATNRPELIGQFGVGFYASFMAADNVTVITRSALPDSEPVQWKSDGQGAYEIEKGERENRGTDVILHLREEGKEFLDEYRLRQIVRQYSDFIEHPVVMDVEVERDKEKVVEQQTLNSRRAIWLKNKSEVKPEEYDEFYQQISRDMEKPAKVIHMAAEGAMEFKALMFIPSKRAMDFFWREPKSGLQLYVRRVLINHECEELLPSYLRFVKGVVDSSDLPLNVSRETLQHNPTLMRIRNNLVNRVLKALEEMKSSEAGMYEEFFDQFGSILKEGINSDFENRTRIAELLLIESTKTEPGKFTSLVDYVKSMPADQKEILYLVGETRQQLASSPYVEAFETKGQEVLLFTDQIDEFVISSLGEYQGKQLKAIDRGQIATDTTNDALKEQQGQYKTLLELLKAKLPEIKEVRLTSRLKGSAACLVADENAMSAHMERMLRRAGRGDEAPPAQRILELNPEHALVGAMYKLYEKSPADPKLDQIAAVLYDQAVIAEGSRIKDPASFAKRINDLIVSGIQL